MMKIRILAAMALVGFVPTLGEARGVSMPNGYKVSAGRVGAPISTKFIMNFRDVMDGVSYDPVAHPILEMAKNGNLGAGTENRLLFRAYVEAALETLEQEDAEFPTELRDQLDVEKHSGEHEMRVINHLVKNRAHVEQLQKALGRETVQRLATAKVRHWLTQARIDLEEGGLKEELGPEKEGFITAFAMAAMEKMKVDSEVVASASLLDSVLHPDQHLGLREDGTAFRSASGWVEGDGLATALPVFGIVGAETADVAAAAQVAGHRIFAAEGFTIQVTGDAVQVFDSEGQRVETTNLDEPVLKGPVRSFHLRGQTQAGELLHLTINVPSSHGSAAGIFVENITRGAKYGGTSNAVDYRKDGDNRAFIAAARGTSAEEVAVKETAPPAPRSIGEGPGNIGALGFITPAQIAIALGVLGLLALAVFSSGAIKGVAIAALLIGAVAGALNVLPVANTGPSLGARQINLRARNSVHPQGMAQASARYRRQIEANRPMAGLTLVELMVALAAVAVVVATVAALLTVPGSTVGAWIVANWGKVVTAGVLGGLLIAALIASHNHRAAEHDQALKARGALEIKTDVRTGHRADAAASRRSLDQSVVASRVFMAPGTVIAAVALALFGDAGSGVGASLLATIPGAAWVGIGILAAFIGFPLLLRKLGWKPMSSTMPDLEAAGSEAQRADRLRAARETDITQRLKTFRGRCELSPSDSHPRVADRVDAFPPHRGSLVARGLKAKNHLLPGVPLLERDT